MNMSEDEVKIRRMTEADLPTVKEIDRLLVGKGRALSWPLKAEAEWTVYRPALSFVAQLGDEIVGFLLGDIRGTEYGKDVRGWIDMMGVAPSHQRWGIGGSLAEAFCEECRRNRVTPNVTLREDDKLLIIRF